MDSYISDVYGKCDGVDIIFRQNPANSRWECDVPADFDDGTYVLEIWAINNWGAIGYYTGKLYMYDGSLIDFKIDDAPYHLSFAESNLNVEFIYGFTLGFSLEDISMDYKDDKMVVITC